MRVFGNFEQPIFLELVKQIEYMSVPANQYLFKVASLSKYICDDSPLLCDWNKMQVGDPDENIFIVQSGQLNV